MENMVGNQKEVSEAQPDEELSEVSADRRQAISKLAYASPVIAGLLFSQRAAAQFTPPPAPGNP